MRWRASATSPRWCCQKKIGNAIPMPVSYCGLVAIRVTSRDAEVEVGDQVLLRQLLLRPRTLLLGLQSTQLRTTRHRDRLELREIRRRIRNHEAVRRLDRCTEHATQQAIQRGARVRHTALVRDQIVLRLSDADLRLDDIELRYRSGIEARLGLVRKS